VEGGRRFDSGGIFLEIGGDGEEGVKILGHSFEEQ
jgi:hypothetical protein